jgi:hypothetical protein
MGFIDVLKSESNGEPPEVNSRQVPPLFSPLEVVTTVREWLSYDRPIGRELDNFELMSRIFDRQGEYI